MSQFVRTADGDLLVNGIPLTRLAERVGSTPFFAYDRSLLQARVAQLRAAFSLAPEYLRTLDRVNPVVDYTDYQPQLGRRMRALKLWKMRRSSSNTLSLVLAPPV